MCQIGPSPGWIAHQISASQQVDLSRLHLKLFSHHKPSVLPIILSTKLLQTQDNILTTTTFTSSWTANISSLVFDSACVLLFSASRLIQQPSPEFQLPLLTSRHLNLDILIDILAQSIPPMV